MRRLIFGACLAMLAIGSAFAQNSSYPTISASQVQTTDNIPLASPRFTYQTYVTTPTLSQYYDTLAHALSLYPTFTATTAVNGLDLTPTTFSGCAFKSNNFCLPQTGIVPATSGGAGAVTGALKANGAGLVSQAASTDLSDTANIGRLNAGQTWTGANAFALYPTFTAATATNGLDVSATTFTACAYKAANYCLLPAATSNNTADGAALTLQNTATTAKNIYGPFGASGTGEMRDTGRFVMEAGATSSITQSQALGAYLLNHAPSAAYPNANNNLAFQGWAGTDVNNSATWAADLAVTDTPTPVAGAVTGRNIYGLEIDATVYGTGGTHVNGLLISLQGPSAPTIANAVEIISPNTNKWSNAFVTDNGAAVNGMILGAAAASGTNINSQYLALDYFNGAGASKAVTLQANGQFGMLNVGSTAANDYVSIAPGTGNVYLNAGGPSAAINLNLGAVGTGAVTANSILSATQGLLVTGTTIMGTVAIASLPACAAGIAGAEMNVNNGTAYGVGGYGSAVGATGAVLRHVICTNTGGPSTYAWAYN